MSENVKKYSAEFFGTMVLVLMGCGSAVIAGSHIGYLGISFAFGLAVVAMVYAIGPISGCHINPAITVAMLAAKKINVKDAAAYIVAQFLGGILGACVLYVIALGNANYSVELNGLGQNSFNPEGGYNMVAAFVAEFLFTAIFLLVIFGVTSSENNKFAGLAIGLTLVLIHIVGIPITGVSVNPARSFGPAIFSGNAMAISQLWLFTVAPILGGLFGYLVWFFVRIKK